MDYAVFESRVLELLYKTDLRLYTQQVAFRVGCTVAETTQYLEAMARNGILVMEIDDDGAVYFDVPGRPPATGEPLSWTTDKPPLRCRVCLRLTCTTTLRRRCGRANTSA